MNDSTIHRLAPITPRRVVVTGMSAATALGFEVEEFWSGLIAGRSGIRRHPLVPDDSPFPVKVAGLLDDAALATALHRYDLSDPDRVNQIGLYVAGRALEDAGFPTDGKTPQQTDVIFGTGHGNISFTTESVRAFVEGGYRKLRPTTIVRAMANRSANIVSIRYQLTGGAHTLSCACATASIAFGEAFHRIRFGLADRVLVACSDTGVDVTTFAAWNRLGVLSKIPEPERASRPFDKNRDGLVIGEGGAAFVLESFDHAQERKAKILAEVMGYGSSSDAKHIVQPDAQGQVKAVHAALRSAGLQATDIDYVNAHATGTELADLVEAASLGQSFGAHAAVVPVSNTKAQLGHLMGASAGVELVATILAMNRGVIPPCRNLDEPDPRCPLNFVRHEPLPRPIRYALKNSFAFGGTNSVVVLGRA